MPRPDFDKVSADVGKHYATPLDLAEDSALTVAEKLELLGQWEHDLRLLLIASDENMTGDNPGRTAELLAAVQQQVLAIAPEGVKKESPAKFGGGHAPPKENGDD